MTTLGESYGMLVGSFKWFEPLKMIFKTVYEELGHGLNESLYQRAICELLLENKIDCKMEAKIDQRFLDKTIGSGYLDILVNNEAIIEIKSIKSELRDEDIRQLHNYLLQTGLVVGICVNFPRVYRSTLEIVILFNSKLVNPSVHPSTWYSLVSRVPTVQKDCHKIKSLGITC